MLAAGVGVLAATARGQVVLVGVLVLAWEVVFILRWRFATTALIILMPFAALPELALHIAGWPTLIKDVLFVAPVYLGFLFALARGTTHLHFEPNLLIALWAFVAIALIQAVHAAFTSPLIGLVGLKTSLWYLPLAIVASSIFTGIDQVIRFVRVAIVAGVIAAGSVIVAAVFVYSGHAAQVYELYGPLASSVTQNFFATRIGGSFELFRVPGIFPLFTQSFGFTIIMFPMAATVALADPDRRWRWIGSGVVVMVSLSSLLSGSRSSWLWLPIQIVLIFTIVGRNRLAIAGATVLSAIAAFLFLGPLLPALFDFIIALSWHYLVDQTSTEFAVVAQAGDIFFGHGVGSQTGAIRYILPPGSTVGIGVEGWYAKTLYEVGLVGLLVVLGSWFLVLGYMWDARNRTKSQPARAYAGALLVIVMTTLINLVKLPYIDLDPLNVCFWFFIGVAISLPRLAAHARVGREASAQGPYAQR